MKTRDTESTVLLTDAEAAPDLAATLDPGEGKVAWYGSLAELVRDRSLSSVEVLVLHFRPMPKGVLLAALGRLNLEYPAIQKVAVMENPLPLPIAEYLTSCGVDLYWPKEANGEGLGALVDRMHERTRWITT